MCITKLLMPTYNTTVHKKNNNIVIIKAKTLGAMRHQEVTIAVLPSILYVSIKMNQISSPTVQYTSGHKQTRKLPYRI